MNECKYAVVTGASGFLGSHVVTTLERQGFSVMTMGVGEGSPERSHLRVRDLADVALHQALLRSIPSSPELIFHVAGTMREENMNEVNVVWAETLLEAARRIPDQPTVVLVGSAAEYGPQHDNPQSRFGAWVTEEALGAPVSAYGRSKLAQTEVGLNAARWQPVVVCRPFNILGRGMPKHLAMGNFVHQALALPPVESGKERRIRTGVLTAVRDFIAVDACAEYMVRLARDSRALGQVINLCTGFGTSMSDLVATLIEQLEPPVVLESAASAYDKPDVVIGATDKLRRFDIYPERCDVARCVKDMLYLQ